MRPITSIKTVRDSARETPRTLARFRDLPHTVCTKIAEAGIPESTMKAIIGHMSRTVLERYSHIRNQAKVDAIQAIESRSAFSVAVPKVNLAEGSKPS